MEPELIYRTTSSLNQAVASFEPNELAYLALTGKIELTIRDRLAWVTQGAWPSPPFFTAREWKKTDLAVIEDGQPVVLLEAKALYSFDAVNSVTLANYEGYIRDDIAKALKLAVPGTQVMAAVFMTHVAAPVPGHLHGIVKYWPGINHALTAHDNQGHLHQAAIESLEDVLGQIGLTKRIDWPSEGEAFGVPVQVDAWVTHANAV
jgi:hypothetical protein